MTQLRFVVSLASILPVLVAVSVIPALGAVPAASPSPLTSPPAASAPAPTPAMASSSLTGIDIARIENTTIYFKSPDGVAVPSPVKTGIYELKYLGALRQIDGGSAQQPYFLFTGRPCDNCIQDKAVYAIRATDGAIAGKLTSFVYPGKVFLPKDRALALQSRAFYGKCLPRHRSDVYVVFQTEHIDRRHRTMMSVFVAEPGPNHLIETLIERRLPRIIETLRKVKAKACHEIEGRNRVMLSKPFDLRPKHPDEQDEEEDRDDDTDDSSNDTTADTDQAPAATSVAQPAAAAAIAPAKK